MRKKSKVAKTPAEPELPPPPFPNPYMDEYVLALVGFVKAKLGYEPTEPKYSVTIVYNDNPVHIFVEQTPEGDYDIEFRDDSGELTPVDWHPVKIKYFAERAECLAQYHIKIRHRSPN